MTDAAVEGSGTEPNVAPVAGSFRDPAGFLYERDGVLLRQVNRWFADRYDAVVASGLYDALHAEGLLIPHRELHGEEADAAAATEQAHRVLRPERLPFVSYPYEWCPGQLREAALLTLRVQDVALDHGMTLRDASGYNVQFRRGRPVFIDTLSFEPRPDGAPWVGYHQFCRHFLAPLALQTMVDVRLSSLLRTDVAGIPLDLASRLLPLRTRLRPSLLTHLHAHARTQARTPADPDRPRRTATFSERALRGLVDSLRGSVSRLTWDPGRTTWSDYYAEADHYSDAAMAAKTGAVAAFLDRAAPASVWDLGANTGRFSRLAAERGADVVAADVDHGAVQAAWDEVGGDGVGDGSVLPLVLDLANPSPDLGWANAERGSLAARGPADAVLALALVHHLAIGGNVPLDHFVRHLLELGRHALVEFVPKDDPKVRVLLATREDVFDDYRADVFEAAAERHARVVARTPLPESGRILYHLERR